MEPQRDPSTLVGGAGRDLSAAGIAAACVTVGIWMREVTPPLEVVLALQVLATAVFGILRRAGEELLARRGGGGTGTAALGSIVVLGAFLSFGCASSTSIPTSSDANVSADLVTAKGGTIACAGALSATLDKDTGLVTSLTCAANGAWTDPPTEQETTALGQFAGRLVELLALPITMLRAALGAAP